MSTSTELLPAKRNELFYLEDIVFLVEDELYRVYAYGFLADSELICSMRKNGNAISNDRVMLGTDDQHPLTLHGVAKHDFELLLSLMYPSDPLFDVHDWLTFDWKCVLSLAERLGMKGLHSSCFDVWRSRFSSMSSAERVLIGSQLGIAEVFIAALKELIIRPDTLNDEEASQLGGKITFRVMQLREQTHVLGRALQGKPDDVQKAIHWTFRTELNQMKFHIEDGAHLDVLKGFVDDRPSASAKKPLKVSTSSKITGNRDSNVFPMRNAYYYDPDVDIVIFQVEDELFRVHKEYFLKHSPVFREMFQVRGQTSQVYLEGKTDEHPLCLQGISKDSFVLFLSVIHSDAFVAKDLERNQWQNVIELALLWRMRSLRLYCIQRLSPLPNSLLPIEKVLVSRKYMAQEWLVETYLQLAQRSEIITSSEASQLGVASAFLLVQLQAKQFKSLVPSTDSKKSATSVSADHVRRSFCDELRRLDSHDDDSEIDYITELVFG